MATTTWDKSIQSAAPDDEPQIGFTTKSNSSSNSTEKALQQVDSVPHVAAAMVTPAAAVSPPPNGGLLAWLQVLGTFFLWFATWGLTLSFGVFQTFYSENYLSSYSPSNIAWIGTVQAFLLFFIGVFTGPLFDRGYMRSLVITGTAFTVLGVMMASIARQYYSIFLSLGVCTGFGMGFLFVPSITMIRTYFTTRGPIAGGLSATGGGVGSLLFPAIFRPLVKSIGFGWTVRVIGFIVLASLMVSIAVLRQRPIPAKPRALLDMTAFRETRFNIFVVMMFLVFAALYTPFFYFGLFAEQKLHASNDKSYYLLAVLGAGSTIGRIVPNMFAMKYGSFVVFAACTLICGLMQFMWGAVHNYGGAVCFALFYGFFAGGVAGISPVATMEMAPSMGVAGTRLGMVLVFCAFGVLVGNPIAGAILVGRSKFEGVEAFSASFLLVACMLIFICWKLLQKFRSQA